MPPAAGLGETLVGLSGSWKFATDQAERGIEEGWFQPHHRRNGWRTVSVPHTWQVDPGLEDYYGVGWYAREFDADPVWQGRLLRLEFDGAYRDVQVWFNGRRVGEHLGSGWTPFSLPIDDQPTPGGSCLLVVRVDNRFSPEALPYLRSFDWAADGGLIRNVRLRVLPQLHIRQVLVSGNPAQDLRTGSVRIRGNVAGVPPSGEVRLRAEIVDPDSRRVAVMELPLRAAAEEMAIVDVETVVPQPRLWHFDHPRRYRLDLTLTLDGVAVHSRSTPFGIRRVEVRKGFFYLNYEPMRLLGLEWMPGSDPRYGMAEPVGRMEAILRDMKLLNVTLTRFHWQQDPAVLEFCDREGILVQEEIPAWGPETMKGELDEIQARQTREMVAAHHNHPSIFAWGLCNEIGGQRPEAHRFVKRGIELVRELDPVRPLTWASNSLQEFPEQDASAWVDFVEWNDYWESWYGGTLAGLEQNLQQLMIAFPDKGVVISEYGLCECDPRNPSGDARRIEILKTHTDRYRSSPQVAGAIFFSYNDYRTHLGDKGRGVYQQRVHGVVDLLDRRKPSWEELRREASPIRLLEVEKPVGQAAVASSRVRLTTRSLQDLPAYTLRDYQLIWTAYNTLEQPVAGGTVGLPDLAPGSMYETEVGWEAGLTVERVEVEVFRPTGYSVHSAEWKRETR